VSYDLNIRPFFLEDREAAWRDVQTLAAGAWLVADVTVVVAELCLRLVLDGLAVLVGLDGLGGKASPSHCRAGGSGAPRTDECAAFGSSTARAGSSKDRSANPVTTRSAAVHGPRIRRLRGPGMW
jgi:hypothetical protein